MLNAHCRIYATAVAVAVHVQYLLYIQCRFGAEKAAPFKLRN